jgi:hypothetical protein
VHPTYTPPANVTKIPGADKVVVDVVVKNEKKHKNGQISWMKNGYNMQVAGLYMHVKKDFKSAIEKALLAHVFSVANNGDGVIELIVHHLFSHETSDWSGITQDGHGSFTVLVLNGSGETLYKKDISFRNDVLKTGVIASTAYRHKIAQSMLSLTVNKIFNSPGFEKALINIHTVSTAGGSVPKLTG